MQTTGNDLFLGVYRRVIKDSDFRKLTDNLISRVYEVFFEQAKRGEIKWERTGPNYTQLMAVMTLPNDFKVPQDPEITTVVIDAAIPKQIPVFLTHTRGECGECAYLMLGSLENAPCRNSGDSRVQELWDSLK